MTGGLPCFLSPGCAIQVLRDKGRRKKKKKIYKKVSYNRPISSAGGQGADGGTGDGIVRFEYVGIRNKNEREET